MKRVAIIGGGISGLSAAFVLEQQKNAGIPLEYVLFESGPRLGGVILSEKVDGCLIEAGPDSFLSEKPWASELCRELGIGDQLIGSNDSQRKTYILVDGKLIPIPVGLAFIVPTKTLPVVLSPLFSFSTKMKMAREWFHPKRAVEGDESVATFVKRHYGGEMVARLADPLLSGVYGGEARHLSLTAVLPRFAAMQEDHGSLTRAVLARRKKARQDPKSALFTSLKRGMQQLVDVVSSRLTAFAVRLQSDVLSLRLERNQWLLSSKTATEHFDSIILAVPAHAAAGILSSYFSSLASELRSIEYSSSVTLCLGFDRNVREKLPPGFGFLVPRNEGKRLLAATFVHNKFPGRAPDDRALIRCFLGGTRDEAAVQLSEQNILGIVLKELSDILGISAEPLFARTYKWKSAMAQYNVGHLERLSRIENLRRGLPHIFLAGNAYGGIGIPDCVRSGKKAAIDMLAAMGLTPTIAGDS